MTSPNFEKLAEAEAFLRSNIAPDELLPRVLPSGWSLVQRSQDGAAYQGRSLHVIVSVATELDGLHWLHVSVSHPIRLPKWSELREVKDLFIGRERKAMQVLPPSSQYVNLHPRVLHLWCCLDGDPLPDFTHGTGSI